MLYCIRVYGRRNQSYVQSPQSLLHLLQKNNCCSTKGHKKDIVLGKRQPAVDLYIFGLALATSRITRRRISQRSDSFGELIEPEKFCCRFLFLQSSIRTCVSMLPTNQCDCNLSWQLGRTPCKRPLFHFATVDVIDCDDLIRLLYSSMLKN